jgi:hypothetical protein
MLDKIGKHCNCTKKECVAPDDSYSCCSQKVTKGKPVFGLWVKKNECDEVRGLPKNAHMHNNKSVSEGYISGFKEGYDKGRYSIDKKEKDKMYKLFLFLILLIMVGVLVKMFTMNKNNL